MGIGVTVELSIEEMAKSITRLNKKDKEKLLLLLSGDNKEIAKRINEIKTGKVKTLTRKEIFQHAL